MGLGETRPSAREQNRCHGFQTFFEFVNREDSPFYISIDLTGEQKDLSIKQGSLAPEIKSLVSKMKKSRDVAFEGLCRTADPLFAAVRSLDPKGWGDTGSTYYKARVLRALIRILTDLTLLAKQLTDLTTPYFFKELKKIDPLTLSEARVRAAQGAAGVTDLYQEIKQQVIA